MTYQVPWAHPCHLWGDLVHHPYLIDKFATPLLKIIPDTRTLYYHLYRTLIIPTNGPPSMPVIQSYHSPVTGHTWYPHYIICTGHSSYPHMVHHLLLPHKFTTALLQVIHINHTFPHHLYLILIPIYMVHHPCLPHSSLLKHNYRTHTTPTQYHIIVIIYLNIITAQLYRHTHNIHTLPKHCKRDTHHTQAWP